MESLVYKTIGSTRLTMDVFRPAPETSRPAPGIVFFFGGGWTGGSKGQFHEQCKLLAVRGMVAISAEYRVYSRHQTSPMESVLDGRSAIRWIKIHATELGLDLKRLAAGGGSAGGHVAMCAAMLGGVDDQDDDARVSCRPDLLVLFNPVTDTLLLKNHFVDRGADPQALSPMAHVRPGLPPMLIMHGTDDTTVPIASIRDFAREMLAAGNECEVVEYPGQKHAFFNYGRDSNRNFEATMRAAICFLERHGYIGM